MVTEVIFWAKYFGISKNGQKKCPKMKIPKYFAKKYGFFGPTCVGTLFGPFFQISPKIPTSCSIDQATLFKFIEIYINLLNLKIE